MRLSVFEPVNTIFYAIDTQSCIVPEDYIFEVNGSYFVILQFGRVRNFKVGIGSELDSVSCFLVFWPKKTKFFRRTSIKINSRTLTGRKIAQIAFKNITDFLQIGEGFFLIKCRHFYDYEKRLRDWRRNFKNHDLHQLVSPIINSYNALLRISRIFNVLQESDLACNLYNYQYGNILQLIRGVKKGWEQLFLEISFKFRFNSSRINLLQLTI